MLEWTLILTLAVWNGGATINTDIKFSDPKLCRKAADAYVREDKIRGNYGSATCVQTKGDPLQ